LSVAIAFSSIVSLFSYYPVFASVLHEIVNNSEDKSIGCTDRQTDRQADRQTDRQIDR